MNLSDKTQKRFQIALDLCLFASALVGFGCLMADLGWNLSGRGHEVAFGISQGVLALFVLQELVRPLLADNLRQYFRTRWPELGLAVIFALGLALVRVYGDQFSEALQVRFPNMHPLRFMLACVSGFGAVGGFLYFLRSARSSGWLSLRKISPSWSLIIGFVGLSTIGTLLLMMPNCQAQPVGWMDCWFVSASASCVTGLTTVNTAAAWTPLGQVIILLLMQLGGLGVMTFTYFISLFLSGGLLLGDRVVLRDLLNEDNIGVIGQMLLLVCGATFLIEALGAAWFYFSFDMAAYADDRLWFSVFHSVSAFCNAGFTLFADDWHRTDIVRNLGMQGSLMFLIVLGGLGFPALKNAWDVGRNWVARKILRRQLQRLQWTPHTRLVMWMTAGLIVVGTLIFYATDAQRGWSTAAFDAVSCRTAGFSIENVAAWGTPAVMLTLFLMFVGGSPGGTGGGVRTTTFAVACLNAWQMLTQKSQLTLFNRSYEATLAQRAFAVIFLSAMYIFIASAALIVLHPQLPPLDLLFEATSAFTTTGLSRGLTAQLGAAGKVIVIFTMIIGRVGIFAFLLALVPHAKSGRVVFPKGTILLS